MLADSSSIERVDGPVRLRSTLRRDPPLKCLPVQLSSERREPLSLSWHREGDPLLVWFPRQRLDWWSDGPPDRMAEKTWNVYEKERPMIVEESYGSARDVLLFDQVIRCKEIDRTILATQGHVSIGDGYRTDLIQTKNFKTMRFWSERLPETLDVHWVGTRCSFLFVWTLSQSMPRKKIIAGLLLTKVLSELYRFCRVWSFVYCSDRLAKGEGRNQNDLSYKWVHRSLLLRQRQVCHQRNGLGVVMNYRRSVHNWSRNLGWRCKAIHRECRISIVHRRNHCCWPMLSRWHPDPE